MNTCSMPLEQKYLKNTKFFFRYFYNSSSYKCQEFIFGGCNGNENKFDDIGSCNEICRDAPNNTVTVDLKTEEVNNFETGFGGWEVYGWRKIYYDSEEALNQEVDDPSIASESSNEVSI